VHGLRLPLHISKNGEKKNQQNQLSLWKTANYQQRRHDPLSAAGSGLYVGVG
jgi:hypothetical protein